MYTTERVDRFAYWLVLIYKKNELEPIGTVRVEKKDQEETEKELKMWENWVKWLSADQENSQKSNLQSSPSK